MVRKVLLESPWITIPASNTLLAFPPDGYEFVQAGDNHPSEQALFKWAGSSVFVRNLFFKTDNLVPLTLMYSRYFQKRLAPPQDTALTYAIQHLVFRSEPWVVEVEMPQFLIGNSIRHLKKYKQIIERVLSSENCRKIICWSEAVRDSFLSGLDCRSFANKFEVVHAAVLPQKGLPPREYNGSRQLKLMFLGSVRKMGVFNQFTTKGGREAVEAFVRLQRIYPDIQMVLRSGLTGKLKSKYESIPNLKILDSFIPRSELEHEYLTSDILLCPSHSTTPHSILEPMSYELAVVSLRTWANAEYVLDGVTGLLVEPTRRVPWELYDSAEFRQAIRDPQQEVVEQIVEKVKLLIENPELRRRLAWNGRYEVEEGRFSLAARNRKLERVFNEALAGEGK